MSENNYGENRHACWEKAHRESKKFENPESMFGSAEVFHLLGELYYRIEELEENLKVLEINAIYQADRQGDK
jgi:hypothetical protein